MVSNNFANENHIIDDADKSIVKVSLVVLTNVILALAASYFLSAGSWFVGLVFFAFFLACFTLQNLFIKDLRKLFLAAVFISGALATPFYNNFSGLTALSITVLALLFFKSSFDSKKELEQAMRIRFSRVAKLSIIPSFTITIIFLGLMSFVSNNGFTEDSVQWFLKPLTPIAEKYGVDFNPETKVGDLLQSVTVANFESQVQYDENLGSDQVSPSVRAKLIDAGMKDLATRLETFIGQKLNWDKSVATNIYEALNSFYAGLASRSRIIFLVLSFFLAYSLIRSLAVLIELPLALLALILYEILLTFNFALIQLEPRSREVIILK